MNKPRYFDQAKNHVTRNMHAHHWNLRTNCSRKTCILFFIGLCIASSSALAQNSIELSFTGGPSVNWLSSGTNEVTKGGSKAGFDFGLTADLFFDAQNRYAITTGLLLSNTGGELDYHTSGPFSFGGETLNAGSSIRYRIQYLEVPCAVKLRTSQFRRWTYWGQFGLSGFINIGAKGDSSDGQLDKTNINDEVKLFNLAMNIGAGADFDLGSGNAFSIGLIYKDGFVDVTKNDYGNNTTVNSVLLKLGLIF